LDEGALILSLRHSMEGAMGRAPLLGNLKDEVFERYTKCPAGRPASI